MSNLERFGLHRAAASSHCMMTDLASATKWTHQTEQDYVGSQVPRDSKAQVRLNPRPDPATAHKTSSDQSRTYIIRSSRIMDHARAFLGFGKIAT